jgi:starch synthase
LPAYRDLLARAGELKTLATFPVTGAEQPVKLLAGHFPGSSMTLYLVDSPREFDRPGNPYVGPDGRDWPDNARRFTIFARAVTALAQGRVLPRWRPELVHCHDWQTGLVPALLAQETRRPATVFTIHNLAYMGLFDWPTFASLHLPQSLWDMHAMEFHNHFSFIKGGLVFADHLTTVSPTYATEIRTPAFGYGLEGLLQGRRAHLTGILNGVDYRDWNPNRDAHLDTPYNARRLAGKATAKAGLQHDCGLAVRPGAPLIGHVGRLVEQKGIDLLLQALPALMSQAAQIAILGSGDKALETALVKSAAAHPGRVAVTIGYDERLAHRIEAGSDMFVMPSRFEPCGLNQLYSLRYGTPPVVHRTGGLADSVVDATAAALSDGTATGFVYDAPTPDALHHALQRALALFGQPRRWRKLMQAGMRQDFSWKRSAGDYLTLYERLVAGG